MRLLDASRRKAHTQESAECGYQLRLFVNGSRIRAVLWHVCDYSTDASPPAARDRCLRCMRTPNSPGGGSAEVCLFETLRLFAGYQFKSRRGSTAQPLRCPTESSFSMFVMPDYPQSVASAEAVEQLRLSYARFHPPRFIFHAPVF